MTTESSPQQLYYPIVGKYQSDLDTLASDNISGATALARCAASIVTMVLDEWQARAEMVSTEEILVLSRALLDAQPAMAPLLHLVNHVASAFCQGTPADKLVLMREAVAGFLRELDMSNGLIAAHMANTLISCGAPRTLLVHSASSSVREFLYHYRESGISPAVVCMESRPQCEGVQFAETLAHDGFHVTLIADAAVDIGMATADCCLVGADAIGSGGVVNKIGTRILALAARERFVPAYVLCSRMKFWPYELGAAPAFALRDIHAPAEIYSGTAPIQVINRYFELTPLDWFTGIVTEGGLLRPSQIYEHLRSFALVPLLEGVKDAILRGERNVERDRDHCHRE